MKRKELVQWALAVVLALAAVAILKFGPGIQEAQASEGGPSMPANEECQ